MRKLRFLDVGRGMCSVTPWATRRFVSWLWVKNGYPKWNPGKWKQRQKPRNFSSLILSQILSHTHGTPLFLGVGSLSILFNHRSFQQPSVSQGLSWFCRKKDAWKEWKWKVPLDCWWFFKGHQEEDRNQFGGIFDKGHSQLAVWSGGLGI